MYRKSVSHATMGFSQRTADFVLLAEFSAYLYSHKVNISTQNSENTQFVSIKVCFAVYKYIML